jgi:hypothetical protein
MVILNVLETRTLRGNAENIGASVFVGGLLGAAGAKLLSRSKWNAAVKAIDSDLKRGVATIPQVEVGVPSSVGAAAHEPVSLEEDTIAERGARLSAVATRAQSLHAGHAESIGRVAQRRHGSNGAAAWLLRKKPATRGAGRVMHVDHPRNPESDRPDLG